MQRIFLSGLLLFSITLYASPITISGQVKNKDKNITIVLKEYNTFKNEQTVLETLAISSEGYYASSKTLSPGIYQLDFNGITKINIAADVNQHIIINLILENKGEPQIEIKGSPGTELIYRYDLLREQSYNRWLKPVRREMRLSRDAGKNERVAQLSLKETEHIAKYQDELARFAKENFKHSIALFYAAIRLNPDRHMDFMNKIASWFNQNRPDLFLTAEFNNQIEQSKKLRLGNTAPNIMLKDGKNKKYQLSALKGKYVLIDFWASWCTPCRVENPNYARLYKKYKQQGFEIFSISIDTNHTLWQQAVRKDKISWINTNDSNGWKSPSVKTYNVSAIPANFLIDRKGKIIAKNVRGIALEKKLEEIFSTNSPSH